jgi:hypothetical protein
MPRRSLPLLPLALGLVTTLGSCRDELPSPPAATSNHIALDAGTARARPGRISPELQKQSRVDACAFGTLGLYDVRDAYLESLGGKEPGRGRVPTLGPTEWLLSEQQEPRETAPEAVPAASDAGTNDPPERGRHADAGAGPGPAATPVASALPLAVDGPAAAAPPRPTRRPPRIRPLHHVAATGEISLLRAVRSCNVASKLSAPPVPELDTELGRFEPFVSALFARLADAARYYRNGEHEKDGFAQGKRLHAELLRDFAQLDERSSTLREAVERWRVAAPAPPDVLDAEAKLGERAVRAARRVTALLVGKPLPTAAAIEEPVRELAQANAALAELATRAPRSPFVRLVAPPLADLERSLDAARSARKADAAVPPRPVREVARRYATVADEWSRACARALGERAGRARAEAAPPALPIRSASPPRRPVARPPAAPSTRAGDRTRP